MFGDIEIEKFKFYRHKTPILLGNVDIEKVLVSNKIYFGEKNYKYFIGYLYNDHRVKPLNILLPKTSAYVKRYDGQTKWMYCLVEDEDLLEKYNTIWDKVSANIKKEFDSEPVYNKNQLKTKIKSQGDDHACLAVISLESALKKDDNYYPQVLLKECKYIEKNVVRHIHDNLSVFSYSSDESDKEQVFFDKYLSWLLFSVLLIRKYTYKV